MADIFKRNSFKALIIIVFLSAAYSPGFCEEPKGELGTLLTMEDAINLAFKNNKDILIQESEIKAAKANILGAQSEFLPKADINAGYTHRDAVMSLPSTIAGNQPKDVGVFVGYNEENRLGISVKQSIFDGGKDIASLKQAKLNLTVQEESLRAKKLAIRFEVKRLYYGLLLAYETEKIAKELVDQAQSHYEEVEERYKENASSRFDLLQSETQVLKVTPQLVRAKKARKLIEAELKKVIGIKMEGRVVSQDKLEYSAIQINEEEFLKQAYLKRPELIMKSLGVDINKQGIQAAKAGSRPQIEAVFNYEGKSNDMGEMFDSRHDNWNAGIQVRVPIFDGFAAKAKVDEAKARYTQAALEKEDLTEQVALEIKHACLDLAEAESIIVSHTKRITNVREALKIAETRYLNRVGTNLDVLDSQVSLSQVEKDLTEAIYDYETAKAYLERSIGESTF